MQTQNISITEKNNKSLNEVKKTLDDYFFENDLHGHLDYLFSMLNHSCEIALNPEFEYTYDHQKRLVWSATQTALLLVKLNAVNNDLQRKE